jgi:hypothetical protein
LILEGWVQQIPSTCRAHGLFLSLRRPLVRVEFAGCHGAG